MQHLSKPFTAECRSVTSGRVRREAFPCIYNGPRVEGGEFASGDRVVGRELGTNRQGLSLLSGWRGRTEGIAIRCCGARRLHKNSKDCRLAACPIVATLVTEQARKREELESACKLRGHIAYSKPVWLSKGSVGTPNATDNRAGPPAAHRASNTSMRLFDARDSPAFDSK
jgi:hypothetical protein